MGNRERTNNYFFRILNSVSWNNYLISICKTSLSPLKKFKCISKLSLNYFWLCIFHVYAMFVNSNIWKSFKNNLSFESYWHHTCIPSGCWRGKRVKISKTNWIWKKHHVLTNLVLYDFYCVVWEISTNKFVNSDFNIWK